MIRSSSSKRSDRLPGTRDQRRRCRRRGRDGLLAPDASVRRRCHHAHARHRHRQRHLRRRRFWCPTPSSAICPFVAWMQKIVASDRIRKEEDLSWKKWSERVNEFLAAMEFFFSPDLFIIGGGVSKKHHKYPAILRRAAPRSCRRSCSMKQASSARPWPPRRWARVDAMDTPVHRPAGHLSATRKIWQPQRISTKKCCGCRSCSIRAVVASTTSATTPSSASAGELSRASRRHHLHAGDAGGRCLVPVSGERRVDIEKPPTLNPQYNIYQMFVRDPNGYLIEIQTFLDPAWPTGVV